MKRRKLWPDCALLQYDDVCYGPPVPKKIVDEVLIIIYFILYVYFFNPYKLYEFTLIKMPCILRTGICLQFYAV